MICRTRPRRLGRAIRPSGFTLIELMVTVAVVGVLAVVGVPAMTGLIHANRLAAANDNLTAALQLARSEAIRRGASVTVCASANGTTCANQTAWTRWIVRGRDNAASAAGPEVIDIMRDETPAGTIALQGPAAGVRFRPSGMVDSAQALTVCMPSTYLSQNQRVVTVMLSGGVRTARAGGGGTCP